MDGGASPNREDGFRAPSERVGCGIGQFINSIDAESKT
jgi:hypothetical protein